MLFYHKKIFFAHAESMGFMTFFCNLFLSVTRITLWMTKQTKAAETNLFRRLRPVSSVNIRPPIYEYLR